MLRTKSWRGEDLTAWNIMGEEQWTSGSFSKLVRESLMFWICSTFQEIVTLQLLDFILKQIAYLLVDRGIIHLYLLFQTNMSKNSNFLVLKDNSFCKSSVKMLYVLKCHIAFHSEKDKAWE